MPKKGANARAKAKVPPQNTAPAPVAAPAPAPAPAAPSAQPAPPLFAAPASNVAARKPEPKKKADIPAPIPIPPKNGLPGGFPSSSPIAEFEQDPFARFTSNEPWPGFSPPNSSSTSSSAGPTPEAEWSEFTAMLNQSSLSSSSAMPPSSSLHNKATDETHSPYSSWGTKNLPFPAHESASAADQEWGASMPSALGSFMNAFTGQQRPPPPPENNNNHSNIKKKAAALTTDTSLSSSLFNAATKTFKGGWGKQHHNDNSAATSPDSATPTAADPKLSFATQMTNGNPFKNGWFNEEEFGVTPGAAIQPALEQLSAPKTAVKGGWGVKPAWGPSKNNNGGNATIDHVDDESPLWGGAAKPSSAIVAAPAATATTTTTTTTTAKGGWTTKSTAKAADHDAWLTSGSPVPTSSLLERGRHHTKSHSNAHTMNTKSPANAHLTNTGATTASSRRGRGAGATAAITREPSRADRVRSEWSSFSLWHESELRTFESAKRAFVKDHETQISRRLMARPPPEHGAIRAQMAEELQGKLREREEDFVERVRGEWESRLVRAGLDVEDWTDMTEAEMSDVSVKLGGGAGSGSSASSTSEDDDDDDDDDDEDEDGNGLAASMEEPEMLLQSSSPLAAFVQRQQKLHGHPLPAEPSMVKDKKNKGSALPQFDANMLNMSGDEMARPLSHMLSQAAHAPWELGDRSETPRPHTFNRAHAHSSRHPLASGVNQDSMSAPHQQQQPTITTSSSSHAAHAATSNSHHPHHPPHHHPSLHAHTSSSSTSTTTTKPPTTHTTTASSYIGPELYDTTPPSTPPSLEEEEAAFKEFKLEVRLQKIREFHAQACELELALAKHLSSLVVRRGGDATDTDAPRKLVAEHKREMEALRATKEEERKAVVEAERERRRMSIRGRDAHAQLGGASNNNKTQQHREPSVVHSGKDLRKQIHAAQLAGQAPVLASPGAVGGPGGRRRTGSNASLSSVPAFLRKTTAENVNSNNDNNNNTSSDEEQQQSEFEVWRPNAAPTSTPQAPTPPAARPESRARAPERVPAPAHIHANTATTTTTKKGKKKATVTVEEIADEDDELPSAIRQLQASAPAVRDNTPSLVPGRSNTPILQEIDANFLASPLPSSASMMMRNLPAVQVHDVPSPFQQQQQQWQSSPSPFQSSSSPSPFSASPLPPASLPSKVRRPSLLSSSRVASSTTTSTLASSTFAPSPSGKKLSPPPAPVATKASLSSSMRGSTGKEEDDEESSDEESDNEETRNDAAVAAVATANAGRADDDDEPDEIFKLKLRAQIESSMQAEVKQAQAVHDENMRKATTSGQRRTLEAQHKGLIRQFNTAARMQYEAALERERAERKLFTGQDVSSGLTEAYVREQQSILEQVRRNRERDSSSSPSTSSSASPPLAASLSSPTSAAVPASLPTPAPVPASATSASPPLSTTTTSSSAAVPIAARPSSRMSRASFSSHSHASVSASMSRTHLPLGFGAGSESESEFDEPMLSSSVSSEQGGFGKHARWTPSAVPDSDTESVIDDTDAFLLHEQSGGDGSSSADTLAQMAAWAFQKEVSSGGGGVSMMAMDKYHNHNQQKQKHQAPPSTRTKHAHLLSSSSLSSPAPRPLATPPPPPMSSSARPKNRARGSFVGSQAGDGSLESWEIALKEVLHTGSSKSNY